MKREGRTDDQGRGFRSSPSSEGAIDLHGGGNTCGADRKRVTKFIYTAQMFHHTANRASSKTDLRHPNKRKKKGQSRTKKKEILIATAIWGEESQRGDFVLWQGENRLNSAIGGGWGTKRKANAAEVGEKGGGGGEEENSATSVKKS